jgi:uncharacterized protein YjbI with pentapeptide repeats
VGRILSNADLRYADLRKANLREADLSGADIFEATLFSVVLDGVNLERTLFGNINLSSCSGLDSIRHLSSLGVDSIILSKGRIPEVFLRGFGSRTSGFHTIRRWLGLNPVLSCFISYSSLDNPFAGRLHDAFQSKGIRCWLDEKQLFPVMTYQDSLSEESTRGTNFCFVPLRTLRSVIG